jgi:LPXTG-motif cell wall-anchored protein
MKKMKKIFALLIAMVMVLGMSTAVFAQTVDTEQGGTATITISNASKGETYAVAKLFDATVSKTVKEDGENTSIAYTGSIPDSLSAYFEKDTAGNISLKDGANISDTAFQDALKTWAASNVTKSAESDGTELTFTNLQYGYYVITTTQGNGLISVDSTRPNATVIDKNTTPPVNELSKSASETDVFIGQTVTYTVSFDTANYYKADENSDPEQIVKYTINDTAATGSLTDITVTSIYVDADADLETTDDQTPLTVQQFDNNEIVINWTKDGVAGESLYTNGAKLVIVYTAVVADTAAIDGAGNTNTVEVTPTTDKGTDVPTEYKTTETIYTYAIAIKKVDQAGQPLAGAKFQFPFYVKADKAADGAYIYAGTEAGDGLINEIETPDDGLIIVKGVKTGDYSVTETAAPKGYNKLTAPETVTATKTGATTTSTTTYLDKDGKIVDQQTEGGSTVLVNIDELAATPIVVVNQTGTELPSTGGIGTTIFYIIGAILVIGAGVVLVTRRRMNVQ